MARWDPAFIIRLSPARHRRAISPNNTDLVGGIDFLGVARGLFGAFAAFATAALLWEKSADPGAIDEVTGASKGREEEEIEEDSVDQILWLVGMTKQAEERQGDFNFEMVSRCVVRTSAGK